MYFWRGTAGPVELAFTDRFGGVSAAPYDELNLAEVTEDSSESEAVAQNWRRVLADFAPGEPVLDMHQVHGAEIATVEECRGDTPRCDGLVSCASGPVLAVRVADCVPVLLAATDAEVIGAVHAGRPGMVAGVVAAAVARMRELGAGRIQAWIGPHVCGRCYEVPQELQDEVADVVPEARATTSWGTPALDIGAGVRGQLEAAGVRVDDVGVCTRESASLYSYRRDGLAAGRSAGLVRRRP